MTVPSRSLDPRTPVLVGVGQLDVPADAYWGAQTQRSIENFPFGPREQMPAEIVHALTTGGLRYAEIPVALIDRQAGRSTVSFWTAFRVMSELRAYIGRRTRR